VALEAVHAGEGGGGDVGGEACGGGRSEAAGAERGGAGRVLERVPGEGWRDGEDVRAEAHHLQRRGVRGAREEGGERDEGAARAPQRGHAARAGGLRPRPHQGVLPRHGVLPQDARARPGESRRGLLRREANPPHVPRHLQCRLRHALPVAPHRPQVLVPPRLCVVLFSKRGRSWVRRVCSFSDGGLCEISPCFWVVFDCSRKAFPCRLDRTNLAVVHMLSIRW
jgi:hypothetical protein